MKNNDWHEAYFDLVNKVECECVQQGDLVPIWDQFKAMSAELAKFKALAEELAGALEDHLPSIVKRSTLLPGEKGDAVQLEVNLYKIADRAAALSEALHQYKKARDAS